MGGGIVVIFFGFLLMWATAFLPAYAIVRVPLARLHFILRVLLSIFLSLLIAVIAAGLMLYLRSKTLAIIYFVVTILASIAIPIVLVIRKLVVKSATSQSPNPMDGSAPWR